MLDTPAKRIALGIALGLLAIVAWQHGWLADVSPVPVAVQDAAIVYESGLDKPLTKEQVQLHAGAPGIGVKVIDKDILGPGKQPSAALKPYLDAAKDQTLPVLVVRYLGGSVKVEPCPGTLAELKARVGK